MIGHSETDSNSAKAANIPFILVKDGYTEKKINEINHDHLIKNFIILIYMKIFLYLAQLILLQTISLLVNIDSIGIKKL